MIAVSRPILLFLLRDDSLMAPLPPIVTRFEPWPDVADGFTEEPLSQLGKRGLMAGALVQRIPTS